MTLECLPKILKDIVLENIIKIKFSSDLTLCDAIEISNNTLSSTYKLNIKDKEEKITGGIFVKYLNKDDSHFKSDANIYFNNEIIFYENIVEIFNEINFDKNLLDTNINFIPKCLHITNLTEKVLIFQSLDGYVSLDINNTLSADTAFLILKRLGQFHAYSFACKDQRSAEFKFIVRKLQEPIFNIKNRSTYGKLFTRSIMDAFKLAKQSLPANSYYVDKFALFLLNIYDEMILLLQEEDDEQYKVVTHGDLWINNVMCKYADEKEKKLTEDIVFTDFQGCRYASPVHDLMFVLLVGVNKELRDNYKDELIRCYHIALCEKLQELNSDSIRLFPFSALQDQLFKHSRFVLAITLAGLPLIMTENSNNHLNAKSDDYLNIESLNDYIKCVNDNKSMKCKNKMMEIIMDVIDMGYL